MASLLFSLAILLQLGTDKGVLCIVATSALVAACLPALLSNSRDIAEPIWLIILAVGLGVTSKAFYLCFGPRNRLEFLLLGRTPGDMIPAAVVMAVGLSCLSIGYFAGNIRWPLPLTQRLSTAWSERRYRTAILFLTTVGTVSLLALASKSNASFTSLAFWSSKRFIRLDPAGLAVHGYLRWGATLIAIAFYLALARWLESRTPVLSKSGMGLCILGLAAGIFPVFVNSRQGLLFLALRILLIWTLIRGDLKLRYAGPLVVGVLALTGAMLSFRRRLVGWDQILAHAGLGGLIEELVGGRNFLDLTKTAHILNAVPNTIDYRYGRTLVTWLVAPIPRSFWPGKPGIGVGGEIGKIFHAPIGSGVPPGLVGELYLNFGLFGALAALFAFGFLLRSIYVTLRPLPPLKSWTLIYVLILTRLALDCPSTSVSGSMSRLMQELLPLLLALWYCGCPVRSAPRDIDHPGRPSPTQASSLCGATAIRSSDNQPPTPQ